MAVKVRHRNGKWWVFIDHKGKRKAKCIGDSKRTAQVFAEKMQAALVLGQLDLKKEEQQQRPFDAYFTTWLETDVQAHCKERTYDLYKQTYRLYLLPAFGQKDIGTITRDEVKKLAYGLLAQGKSHASVRFILAPLSALFRQALEDGHLSVHPATRILRHVHTAPRKQADFLTEEEAGRVLHTCHEHFPASYPLISLLVRTGLRLGEALALKWEAIDFAGRFIDVRHTLTPRRTLSTPKSKQTRRVDMSLQLTETLKALLLKRKKDTLHSRVPSTDKGNWVFQSTQGTVLYPANLRTQLWTKLLQKAEIRHIRLHDLRHTYASLLIQHGESLAYVKEQMGHHSIKMTVDTYGHLMPGGNKAAVDRLDGLENATFRNPAATASGISVLRSTGSE